MSEKILAVMVGDVNHVEFRGEKTVEKGEVAMIADETEAMEIAKILTGKSDLGDLEYDVSRFVVKVDGKFVEGYYPYYSGENWDDGVWYAGLLLKLNGEWYVAEPGDGDPTENAYGIIEFARKRNLKIALMASWKIALDRWMIEKR